MDDIVQEAEANIKYRMRYLSEETKRSIFTDYQAEMPVSQIVAKYGISRGTVYNVLNRVKKEVHNDNEEESEQS